MARDNTTIFFTRDVDPAWELARLLKNEKILNLAKGNLEHAFYNEEGEAIFERCKDVYALLKTFTRSEWDSEENERVALCIAYLKLGFGGCWFESFYRLPRACLVELYPAITTLQRRIELWKSINEFGAVCKAARDASAYTVPGKSKEDAKVAKAGSPVPVEIENRMRELIAKERRRQKAKTTPKNDRNKEGGTFRHKKGHRIF